jgi:hypothetical protein
MNWEIVTKLGAILLLTLLIVATWVATVSTIASTLTIVGVEDVLWVLATVVSIVASVVVTKILIVAVEKVLD